MPWCPKCKNEYVEGIQICADCGSKLVESLPASDEQTEVTQDTRETYPAADTLPDDLVNALHMGRRMHEEQTVGVYEEASQKAEEFKSGSYTLLIVGILGLTVLGFLLSGKLPVKLDFSSQWMLCLVMGALFILFIVLGIQSFRTYRKQVEKAGWEKEKRLELENYIRQNLSAKEIDDTLSLEGTESEETLYFLRTDRLKQHLTEHFGQLEEAYLENFADEIYTRLFEE